MALSEPLRLDDRATRTWLTEDEASAITISSNRVRLWNVRTHEPRLDPLVHDQEVTSVVVSQDGQRLATAARDKSVRLWDARTGRTLTPPLLHEFPVETMKFSGDGQLLLTIASEKSASPRTKAEVRIWDGHHGRLLAGPLKYAASVSAGFSPDSQRLVTASFDRTAQVWEARTGQPLTGPLEHQDPVYSAEFSLDGRYVATMSGGLPSRVWRVWNAQTGHLFIETIHAQGADEATGGFRADETWPWVLYIGTNARVWDMWTGLPLTELLAHTWTFIGNLSHDGRWLVTGLNLDRGICVWEIPTVGPTAPSWLADLAEGLIGKRITAQGITEAVPESELDALTRRWTGIIPANDLERWIHWFLADPATRMISPSSPITRPESIQRCLKEDALEGLREAALLSPTNALVFARLGRKLAAQNSAAHPSAPGEADWCSRYAVRLAPNDPEILQIREGVLEKLRITAGNRKNRSATP
jgi:hypothetical protein